MILVDTSVLIGLLCGSRNPAVAYLRDRICQEEVFALTPIVVQEILQGACDLAQWRKLSEYLSSQRMLYDQNPNQTASAAARIYFDCRRLGITVRSTVDCLIAQIAVQHDVPLLHADKDFDAIKRVCELKTLPG
jgi:predicted nucleic acid-binding protein